MKFAGETLALIGRPIAFYPVLAEVCGGLGPGVLFCQLTYWHGKQRDLEGWIRKSWTELNAETGMTRREQQGARVTLRQRGVIEERVRGVPATVEYRLNFARLDLLLDSCPAGGNQLHATGQLNAPYGATIPETTAETTSESTCVRQNLKIQEPQQEGASATTPRAATDGESKVQAAALIAEINRISGRQFSVRSKVNLAFARARLVDYPFDELVRMFRWRWRTWDAGWREGYFRPETLLNATKCESYMGGMPADERAGRGVLRRVARNPELERIAARDRELGRFRG